MHIYIYGSHRNKVVVKRVLKENKGFGAGSSGKRNGEKEAGNI